MHRNLVPVWRQRKVGTAVNTQEAYRLIHAAQVDAILNKASVELVEILDKALWALDDLLDQEAEVD